MAIGQRIKFFRNLRKLTQKELGQKLGFPERAADVRIAQYEAEKRIPKESMVENIANILDVSPLAVTVPDIDNYYGLMHTLFTLEDIYGMKIDNINGNPCITFDRFGKSEHIIGRVDLWLNEYQKFLNGEITEEEYNQWRYTFPKIAAEQSQRARDAIRETDKKFE